MQGTEGISDLGRDRIRCTQGHLVMGYDHSYSESTMSFVGWNDSEKAEIFRRQTRSICTSVDCQGLENVCNYDSLRYGWELWYLRNVLFSLFKALW